MLRVLLRPRVIQTLVSPACITHWQIGSCRGAHKGGKRTWAEEAQRELAAIEKKRRRRIANARLRNWAADENLISYISVDLRNRETVREQPISADERWRRQLGQLRARHNSRKANQGWAKYRQRRKSGGGATGSTRLDDDDDGDDGGMWHQHVSEDDEELPFRREQYSAWQREEAEMQAELFYEFQRMTGESDHWARAAFRDGGFGASRRGFEHDPQDQDSQQPRPRHSPSVMNHLRVLGLPAHKVFDASGLKAAFHCSAKIHHPDLHLGDAKASAEVKFKRIQEAYTALCAHLENMHPMHSC